MMTIKDQFKDGLQKLSGPAFDFFHSLPVVPQSSCLKLLDAIDQYHNEVVRRLQLNADSLANTLAESTELIIKAQNRIEELEGRNRELLEMLIVITQDLREKIEGSYGNYEDHSVLKRRFERDIEPVVESESLIAKYKGGDGES